MLRWGIVASLLLLGGCATLPSSRHGVCEEARRPAIAISEDGRTASMRLDVLTYNVEGLSWPARSGRAPYLKEIAARLNALRARGEAPDIILFQEVFSKAAVRTVETLDYPSMVAGPARSERRPRRDGPSLPGSRRPHRGELGFKLFTGGLVTVAEYPVVGAEAQPFPRRSCAGFDCLANKGVLSAELAVPGLPGTIMIFNTHMNSQRASRVPARRHHAAHAEQVRSMAELVASVPLNRPVIFGGDFNMRHSELRFDTFQALQPLELVHRRCMEENGDCDVRMSWDGDAPWMDTQDLQLFSPGDRVSIRPVRVEAMFDDGPSGPRLSDHDGFRVLYELSWPVGAPSLAPQCPA